jgi:Alr-MurF fusion protein
MRSLNLSEFVEITGGELLSEAPSALFNSIDFDTRRIVDGRHSLFVVIKGENHDGHKYIQEAWKLGVRNFILSDREYVSSIADSNILLVQNSLKALQSIAGAYRDSMPLKIIGITGSNGKTIVKEWLNQLLAEDKRIVRNPRSYNSQLGVPISLMNIEAYNELGIFEVGISEKSEMAIHQAILKPNWGIFINIGSAHLENFSDKLDLAREKMQLFKSSELLLCSADYPEILEARKDLSPSTKVLSWSMRGNSADLEVLDRQLTGNGSLLELNHKGEVFKIDIPFSDDASTENTLACILCLLEMGYSSEIIAERCKRLSPVAMRMEVLNGINGSKLINDSYNTDIYGLGIALDLLDQQSKGQKKSAIISDMYQTGLNEENLYSEIASKLNLHGVNDVVAIGPAISRHLDKFTGNIEHYLSSDDFLQTFNDKKFSDKIILIKGSRQFEFEQIVKRMVEKVHDTILEIDLNKMGQNLGVYRSILAPGIKVMAVVKAFSYGSGSEEIARFLEFQKIDYLAVAYTDEGIRLREAGISTPIMVMNPERSSLEALIRYRLEPEISRWEQLHAFENELEKKDLDQAYPIHIKVDTGMNRLGFELFELEQLGSELLRNSRLKVLSVFSHLAASEEPDFDVFSRDQIKKFEQFCDSLEAIIGHTFLKHIANSAAIPRFPGAHFDMVRLGIGLYGIDPGFKLSKLQPVGVLKTVISQIKNVAAGSSVGYGRKFIANEDMRIAIIPIGYADGYRRMLGNGKGAVLIQNKLCRTIGNVCMDLTMIDLAELNVNVGDEVIVMGSNPSAVELARWMDTIAYEVFTSISPRVKRVYIQE